MPVQSKKIYCLPFFQPRKLVNGPKVSQGVYLSLPERVSVGSTPDVVASTLGAFTSAAFCYFRPDCSSKGHGVTGRQAW